MKTGIFGGTFNPIHNSHLYLADEFARLLGLDRIIVIPSHTPPHKPSLDLVDPGHRLAMCQLAVEGKDGFSVCDMEIRRQGKSYTWQTLEQLHEGMPGAQLHLLMGADMFLSIQDWKCPEKIYRHAVLCAAARQPGELEAMRAHIPVVEQGGGRCTVVEIPPKPLSSTQVRGTLQAGGDVSAMVPAQVLDYIRSHNLYGGGADA